MPSYYAPRAPMADSSAIGNLTKTQEPQPTTLRGTSTMEPWAARCYPHGSPVARVMRVTTPSISPLTLEPPGSRSTPRPASERCPDNSPSPPGSKNPHRTTTVTCSPPRMAREPTADGIGRTVRAAINKTMWGRTKPRVGTTIPLSARPAIIRSAHGLTRR